MLILGIETSCDETAAAVVEDGRRVRSNVVASQNELHAMYGGVVPELASRAHAERILPIVRSALDGAGVGLGAIDAIAVGHRPGLIGSLLVGVAAAKALAWSVGRPLIGVDHVHAHLYGGVLGDVSGEQGGVNSQEEGTEARRHEGTEEEGIKASRHRGIEEEGAEGVLFPALGLVVSGGHTSLYELASWSRVRRLGATIDDAMGEAFDKAATILGLGYPGGPNLDRLAQRAGADDGAFEFPVARIGPESLDFSFSGLKTSLLYAVRGTPVRGGGFERDHTWLSEASKADLAASFQRAAVRAAIMKLERAIARGAGGGGGGGGGAYRALVCGGGVTANSRLRRELAALAASRGLRLVMPAMGLCVDNAAMIAGLAHALHAEGAAAGGLDLQAEPTTAL